MTASERSPALRDRGPRDRAVVTATELAPPAPGRAPGRRRPGAGATAAVTAVAVAALVVAAVGLGRADTPEADPPSTAAGPADSAGPTTTAGAPRDVSPPSSGLQWDPPELADPTVVTVPVDGGSVTLGPGEDALLEFPDTPVIAPFRVDGGRHIVAVGGAMRMESGDTSALWFNDHAGTLHLEGLRIDPGGARGIDQDALRIISAIPGSIAQVQRVWVDLVHGSYDGEHGDVLQTWAGPTELRVDRMTGFTDYQGFFLAPSHFGPEGLPLVAPVLSNIDLHMVGDEGYALFAVSDQGVTSGEEPPPLPTFHRVVADPGPDLDFADVATNPQVSAADPGVREWTEADGNQVDRDAVGLAYEP